MILNGTETELKSLVTKQIDNLFGLNKSEIYLLNYHLTRTLERCEYCFSHSSNKYYRRNDMVFFNPFHSGQYSIFLYMFSNEIYKHHELMGEGGWVLADKCYYLNKVLRACDLFYEAELPSIFMLDHPVGSVMGRAKYSDYFSFGQNCTVGNNHGIYPVIGDHVKMCANSMILGNCTIGNNVIIGAAACIKDENIPDNSLVFGNSPNLLIKPRKLRE
jgi:serine O-acetyltransferase